MKKKNPNALVRPGIALIALLALVTSVVGEAKSERRRPGKGFGFHHGAKVNDHLVKANLDRLLEATKEIVKAEKLSQRGRGFQANMKLRIAGYRVRLVLATINYTGIGEDAQEAVHITAAKLQDRYLPVEDKIEIALDCLSVAIGQLAQEVSRKNTFLGASKALKFISIVGPTCRFGPVENVLVSALQMLDGKRGRKAQAISDALEIALEKVTSPYLPPAQKLYFLMDCVGVAQSWLKR